MTLMQNFIGSFIEICSMFYILKLFDASYLDHKWKVVAIALIVAVVNTVTYKHEYAYDFIFYYGIIIVLNWRMFHIRLLDASFQLCFGIGIFLLIQFILISTMSYLNFDPSQINIIAIDLFFGFVISWLIGSSIDLQNWVRKIYFTYRSQIYLFSLNVFIVAFCSKWIWESTKYSYFQEQPVLAIIIVLWCSINIYLFLKLMQNKRQREMIELHEQYREMTESLLDDLYKGKHEFSRHLQTIFGYTETEEPQMAIGQIHEYILEIMDQRDVQKEGNFSTGDSIINAMLYLESKKAKKDQIAFYYIPTGIFPYFPCEKHELIEIIGNLLSNAFEHVVHLTIEDRKVFLKIGENNGKSQIEVRNTYGVYKEGFEHQMIKKGYTTKEGARRGYGLTIVKAIASKYKGEVLVCKEGKDIIIEVLF